MNDKIKDFFQKKDIKTESEKAAYDKKMNIVKLIGCLIFLIIMIVYVNFMPKTLNENISNGNEILEDDIVTTELDKINNNYLQKVTIIRNLEEYVFEREVLDNTIVGRETTTNGETNYVYYDNNYYLISQEEMIKKDNTFKPFLDFDQTFIDINTIKEIIELSKEVVDLQEENYKIKRYKISLSDLIVIYNRINNTEVALKENKELLLNVNYNENIESIEIDLIELYKAVGKTDIKQIEYKIEYSNIGEIEMEGVEDIVSVAN